ncbi:MAG: hypothetical protein HY840_08465 [Bacteroidetes bacterium]|nr:hypothetical protein [Bacteroidota bacterium]
MKKRILIPVASFSLLSGLLLLFFNPSIPVIISSLEYIFHKSLSFSFWEIGFERMGVELILLSVNIFLAIKFYEKNPKRFILFSCFLWMLLFILYVIKNTVNIPISDDYGYFLQFLIDYSSSHNHKMIFRQEAESRMVLIHLLSILLVHLNIFNFKIFAFISTACLIGITLLLYRSILLKQKEFLFFIIAILLFQFQYYNSILLPSDALYSTCTIFYVFCSLYFLNKRSLWMFALSLFFILLSALNCGSGFSGFIAGTFLLLAEKRWKHLFVWILFAASISAAFFTNYAFIHENIFSSETILVFLNRSFKCALLSFAFLGGPLQFPHQIVLPIITGAIIWIFFIILTIKKYYKINPIIYFMLLFLIICSCLPSLLRPDYEIKYAISIRYGVYAIIAMGCCIIAFIETSPEKNKASLMKYLLIATFLFHLSTNLFFYPEVVIRKQKLIAFIEQIKKNEPLQVPPITPCTAEEAAATIKEAVSKNIYKIPDE